MVLEATINKPEGTYSSILCNRGEKLPHAPWLASKPEDVGISLFRLFVENLWIIPLSVRCFTIE
jgi:hypothetical protein